MFPSTWSCETLFPKGPVIKLFVIQGNKERKKVLIFQQQHQAAFNCMLWSRATAVNISRVTVNYFPFYIIVFAVVAACGIWRWTVSLSDVMWPWTSHWMGEPWREKRQLYKKFCCISLIHNYSAQFNWIKEKHGQSTSKFNKNKCCMICTTTKLMQKFTQTWHGWLSVSLPYTAKSS